jgi:hypothetical protein
MKQFKEIRIQFIKDSEQRYDTAGDYFIKNEILIIKISKQFKDRKRQKFYEWLILIHEIIEVLLVIARGISIKKIDEFDKEFNKTHEDGEPGDDLKAPYYKEHKVATKIEKIMAKELNVNWKEYNEF